MGVTKKYSNGYYWWLKLSVGLVVAFMYCGLMTQSVYAEVIGAEMIQQQNVVSNNLDSNSPIKQQKKGVPTLTLTLQDEDGKPISGVTISAMEGDFVGKERKSATTNKNGKVVFKHLKSGTYYFYANIDAIQKHTGYGLPGAIRSFKTAHSYYISESKQYDLSENVEGTYTIKKGAYVLIETFLDVSLPQKIVIVNKKWGIEQMIPVAATDFIQIYMPMRERYQMMTIKDNDFDSWIIEFYAHDRLHIELL